MYAQPHRLPSLVVRLLFACAIAVIAAVVSCANGNPVIPGADGGTCMSGCSGATPVCNAATGMCVGCLSNADCPDGGVCGGDGGTCLAACSMDSQCKDPTNPRCDTTTGKCVPCLPTNNNCPSGYACVETQGVFACTKGCATAADCSSLIGDAGHPGGLNIACCNGLCVDLGSNPDNCHACGNVCPGVQACCTATCTDLAGNAEDCGGCGTACSHNNVPTPTCLGGVCNGTCAPGFADCNNNKLADGCETPTGNDPAHCGGCGTTCSSNNISIVTCANGVCDGMCLGGTADCNHNKQTDGCETNVGIDPQQCGACGVACSTNHVPVTACTAGVCSGACAAGWSDCNNNKQVDGCEADTATDAMNCGGCGTACSTNNVATVTCANSVCNGTCAPGWFDCNMNKQTDGCEANLQTTPQDCGACGTVCSSNNISNPTCAGGVCNGTCNLGFADCNNNKQVDGCEVSTGTDPNNCGTCGHVCNAASGGNTCSGGMCINNYTVGPSTQAFVNACTLPGEITYLPNQDDGAILAPYPTMPITFVFYGVNALQYWVNADGAMGFINGAVGAAFGSFTYTCPLPSTSDPELAIMPFAVDQVTRTGICVAVTGTAPNRQMILTTFDAYIYDDTTSNLTYSVFLNETTNTIDIVYQTMTAAILANGQGATAVVGIQSANASLIVQNSCHTASEPSGTAIRFTP